MKGSGRGRCQYTGQTIGSNDKRGLSIYWQRCEPGKSGIRIGIVTNCTALSDVSTAKSIINLRKERNVYDLKVRNLYPPWIGH